MLKLTRDEAMEFIHQAWELLDSSIEGSKNLGYIIHLLQVAYDNLSELNCTAGT